ncbi:MAG: hypothetical protein H3C50_05900 [Kiritimatiellae bacterium]|nr:hypothetical protein [Kiritimatiellia bacterium]MCO5069555.1 hypothetical protein [Kiritimatiellia bacterium]
MADEQIPSGDNPPPKIKLNLAGTGLPPRDAVPPIQIRPTDKKAETTRLDLKQAVAPIASVGDTQPVQADISTAKRETQRLAPAAPNVTMRIETDEARKKETARIDLPESAFQKKPGTQPRSVAPEGAEEVFKRSTIPVGIPTPPPTKPKTIAVKRPLGTQPAKPATVVVSPAEKAVAEAKKSETARIDLPSGTGEDRPATRPKTIRIKRPDGTSARKALTISRPDEDAAPIRSFDGEEEEAGSAFSIIALVAVLVTCVLLYVLAAQSIAPNLPWPGRL